MKLPQPCRRCGHPVMNYLLWCGLCGYKPEDDFKIGIAFRWYDLWVGAYYQREERTWHVCLLPTICISIRLRRR